MTPHKHAEAYRLMTYRADDGSEEEVIWNSRDGVTPFVVTLRSGKSATHVEWHRDRYEPNYQPPSGSRVFVDLTEPRARELALANAVRWFSQPPFVGYDPRERWATPEAMAADLASDYLTPGAPDLVEVP